jgi:hypothetical protein
MKPPQWLLIGLFAVFGIHLSGAEDEVLPWDALNGEKQFRATVEKRFPGLEFGFYHWSGDLLIGALEDFDNHKILLLMPVEGTGEAKISRNGKELPLPLGESATLRVAGILFTPDGNVSAPDIASDVRVGYWVPLEATDRLTLSMKLTWPAEGFFEASYDPDGGWKIASRWDETKPKRKGAADAYEISRRSLLDRVIEVLKEKQKCRLRMTNGFEVTISDGTDDQAPLDPLVINLSEQIAVGLVEPREIKSEAELELQLKSYQSAAKAAGERARVLVRLSADAKDEVFRTSLKALADQGFSHFEIARTPK